MPLTYQPFAETPSVNRLTDDLHMNVSDSERTLCGIAGALLVGGGLARQGLSRWLLLAAGAALARRSWTGFCPYYDATGADTRHAPRHEIKRPELQLQD